MQPLALSRQPLIFASVFVLFVILARPGETLKPSLKTTGVSVQEAIALIDAGALVIDVRDGPKTHIPGALLIPLEVLDAHLSKLEAAKAQQIVVYCGDGSTRGPEAAQLLTQAGFARVANLAPGIEGWRAAGFPTVSG